MGSALAGGCVWTPWAYGHTLGVQPWWSAYRALWLHFRQGFTGGDVKRAVWEGEEKTRVAVLRKA
jgi:hypothetical protein